MSNEQHDQKKTQESHYGFCNMFGNDNKNRFFCYMITINHGKVKFCDVARLGINHANPLCYGISDAILRNRARSPSVLCNIISNAFPITKLFVT